MDDRRDQGQYYPGGKVIPRQPVRPGGGGGDVYHADFANVQPIGEEFTDNQMRDKLNEVLGKLKGGALCIVAAFVCTAAFGALRVQKARKGDVLNSAMIVTNVTGDAGIDTNGVEFVIREAVRTNYLCTVDEVTNNYVAKKGDGAFSLDLGNNTRLFSPVWDSWLYLSNGGDTDRDKVAVCGDIALWARAGSSSPFAFVTATSNALANAAAEMYLPMTNGDAYISWDSDGTLKGECWYIGPAGDANFSGVYSTIEVSCIVDNKEHKLSEKLDINGLAADSVHLNGKTDAQLLAQAEAACVGKLPYALTNVTAEVSLDRSVQYVNLSASAPLTINLPPVVTNKVTDFVVYAYATSGSALNLDSSVEWYAADASATNALEDAAMTAFYFSEMGYNSTTAKRMFAIGRQKLTNVR